MMPDQHPTNERLLWPDLARGIAVLLVVVHHVVRQMDERAPSSWGAAASFWTFFDNVVSPIRIPLFFFLSGFLVSKGIGRSLGERRTPWIVPAYLYTLWSTLLTLRLVAPGANGEHSMSSNFVGNLLLAGSGYWYLYALPLYYTYAHLTRRISGWYAAAPLIVALAFRGPVTAYFVEIGGNLMDQTSLIGSVFANGIFYWLGARYGISIVGWISERGRWESGVIVFAYFAVTVTGGLFAVQSWTTPVASFLGIAVGVFGAVHAARPSRMIRGIGYIGRRTLPVYVAQFFFISMLSLAWSIAATRDGFGDAMALAWLYPIVVTSIVASISLLFYEVATRSPLTAWLFRPPSFVLQTRK